MAGKRGRPAFEVTDEARSLVRELAGFGLSHEQIARVVTHPKTGKSISADTLKKYFSEELDEGKAGAAAEVARTAYRMAVSGEAPAMTMFWLKTQLGWRETQHLEHTGAGGAPLQPPVIQFVHDGQD